MERDQDEVMRFLSSPLTAGPVRVTDAQSQEILAMIRDRLGEHAEVGVCTGTHDDGTISIRFSSEVTSIVAEVMSK